MTKPQYPSEKLDQYMLRLPDGMRERLKALAEGNKRSLNAEIIARLEESLEEKRFIDAGKDELFDKLVDLIGEHIAKHGKWRDNQITNRDRREVDG